MCSTGSAKGSKICGEGMGGCSKMWGGNAIREVGVSTNLSSLKSDETIADSGESDGRESDRREDEPELGESIVEFEVALHRFLALLGKRNTSVYTKNR